LKSDRYRLERLLGEGNKKRVHLALDTHLHREVALAFVKTAGLDEDEVSRVREEARDLARLGDHPHVVTIHDILEEDGEIALVMEYLAGGDLRAVLARSEGNRLPIERTLRIGEHLAQALEHAHGHGVLHRDLNPANVWIGASGSAKLGDFGLAVSLARSRMVREGLLVTAVAYMAPEQALGRSADERGDLYSLGAVLYELTTGRPPFLGDDAVSVLSQHIHTAPVAPSWHNPSVPPALEALILRLLAKPPEERPPSASAVREVLAVIAAAEVNGLSSTPRGVSNPLDRLASGVFVGRDAEMTALRAAVEDAFSDRGSCLLLAGEPGIGKTRCAEELATYARLRNARVLVGRCVEGEGAPAYWPWVQILRELASQLGPSAMRAQFGPDAGELGQIVPELVERSESAGASGGVDALQLRFRLFDAVVRVLTREAAAHPLVLLIDDLHRADTPSLLLLQHVVRETARARVLVVGTYRDVEVDDAHPLASVMAELAPMMRELVLENLDIDGLARFIEIATGTTAPDAVVESIHELTQGNPLFVTEVVRLLVSEGRMDQPLDDRRDRISRAPGIRHTIGRRLESLSEATRHALSAAAVLGREFDLEMLEHTVADQSSDALMRCIDEALATRTIDAIGDGRARYRFTHVLIRDALYEGLTTIERLRAHRIAAEVIAARHALHPEPHLAELAYHFGQAAPAAPEMARKALDFAVRAGDHARDQLAWEEAAAYYKLALNRIDQVPEASRRRAEILCSLGEVRWSAGDTPRAREAFMESARLARTLAAPALLGRAAFGYAGRTDTTIEVDHAAVALMEEALRTMSTDDDPLRATLTARLATALYFSGDRKKPVALAREALAMAERLDDTATLAYALSALHYVLWGPGNVEERLFVAERQIRLGKTSGARDVVALGHYAAFVGELERGDVVAADKHLTALAAVAEELRQPFFDWQAHWLRSLRALLSGELEAAEVLLHETLAHGQRAHSPNAVTLFGGQLYFLRREQGRLDELSDAIETMVRENPSRSLFRFALANLYVQSGRETEARDRFEQLAARDFADLPLDMSFLDNLWFATQICDRLGDVTRARRIYELLRPYADTCIVISFATAWCGSVSHCLGMLASLTSDFAAAEEHFEAALAVHRRAGARLLVAHTQRQYARMLRAKNSEGDAERAADFLSEASACYASFGLNHWLDGTRAIVEEPVVPETGGRFAFHEGNWTLDFAGATVRLRDARGLQYLAQLIESPRREMHVNDLVVAVQGSASEIKSAAETGLRVIRAERGSEPLDATAREQYRHRLDELREQLGDAEARNDIGATDRARQEIALIEAELTSAFGLSGRARRSGDAVERARKSVSNRIRDSIRRIEQIHPRLGRHLKSSIRTGTYCIYEPEMPVSWER